MVQIYNVKQKSPLSRQLTFYLIYFQWHYKPQQMYFNTRRYTENICSVMHVKPWTDKLQ